jgi:hypothetical protein
MVMTGSPCNGLREQQLDGRGAQGFLAWPSAAGAAGSVDSRSLAVCMFSCARAPRSASLSPGNGWHVVLRREHDHHPRLALDDRQEGKVFHALPDERIGLGLGKNPVNSRTW